MLANTSLNIRVGEEVRLPYLELLTTYGHIQAQMKADVERLPRAFQNEVYARISHVFGEARNAGLGQQRLTRNLTLLNKALIEITKDVSNANTFLSLFKARTPPTRKAVEEAYAKFSAQTQAQVQQAMRETTRGNVAQAVALVFKDFDPSADQAPENAVVNVGPAIRAPYLALLDNYAEIQKQMAAQVAKLPLAFQREVFARLSVAGGYSEQRNVAAGQQYLTRNLTVLNNVLIEVTKDVSTANHVANGNPEATFDKFSPTARAAIETAARRNRGMTFQEAVAFVFKDFDPLEKTPLDDALNDLFRRTMNFTPSIENVTVLESLKRELQEIAAQIPHRNIEQLEMVEAIEAKLAEHTTQIFILSSQDIAPIPQEHHKAKSSTAADLIRVDLQGASQYDGTGQRPPACTFHAVCAVETLIRNFDAVVVYIQSGQSRELSTLQRDILRVGQQQYDSAVGKHRDLVGGAFLSDLRKHSLLPRTLHFQNTHEETSGSFDHRLTNVLDGLNPPRVRGVRYGFAIIQNGNEETLCVVSNNQHSIIFDSHRNQIILAQTKEATRAYLAGELLQFSNEMEFDPEAVRGMGIDPKTCGPNCEVDMTPFFYTCGSLAN